MTNLINQSYRFCQWYARYGHDHLVEIICCLFSLAIAFIQDCRAAYSALSPKVTATLHTAVDLILTVVSFWNYIQLLYSERVISTPVPARNYMWLDSDFWS